MNQYNLISKILLAASYLNLPLPVTLSPLPHTDSVIPTQQLNLTSTKTYSVTTIIAYLRLAIPILLLIIAGTLAGSHTLNAQKKDDSNNLIHRYDLFKELKRRLPANWEIYSREGKQANSSYFAIIRKNSWRVNRSSTYNGPAEKEEEWAKTKGEEIPFEMHLKFEPADNSIANVSMAPPVASQTTTSAVAKPPNEEIITALEEKYKISELEKNEDTKTYMAYTKEEKDRLVYFMLSKEYYTESSGNIQQIIAPPVSVPKNETGPALYVKDFRIVFDYLYSTNEYRPYPKSIDNELNNIETLIRKIVNKQ